MSALEIRNEEGGEGFIVEFVSTHETYAVG